MKSTWNDKNCLMHYNRTIEDAKSHGFTAEELSNPYLDKLSHQTKSPRILRMIELAYYLGKIKGIQEVDEGKTKITMSGGILRWTRM